MNCEYIYNNNSNESKLLLIGSYVHKNIDKIYKFINFIVLAVG